MVRSGNPTYLENVSPNIIVQFVKKNTCRYICLSINEKYMRPSVWTVYGSLNVIEFDHRCKRIPVNRLRDIRDF